jgi:hypothetical protein
VSARPTNAATVFLHKILHNRWRGGGGDITNLMVIGYSTMLVELTGSVIIVSFVMGGRVQSRAVSAHVVVVVSGKNCISPYNTIRNTGYMCLEIV